MSRTQLIGGTLGALVAGLLLATAPAVQAAPAAPVVVSPPPGASGVTQGSRLTIQSPHTGATVRFALRRDRGRANTAAPFTWLAVPDTQHYVQTAAYRDNYRAQMQWIVDNADDLDLALVSHLGDVVETSTSRTEYQVASGYQRILDDAGVPNTVVPGNHDMNVTTGDAALYDEFFPVSRYADAGWNSSAVRYGGYYGQSQFGPDPADRKNKNSYVLLTAGGMDLLVVNLEFNAPDDVLAWAGRVIEAHPDRRAMIVTHNMIGTDGNWSRSVYRPGGNYPEDIWGELIASHCSVFFVINGHNHTGTEGEANRTLTNDCGQPVHLALSDYQTRPNGGDGLLRYYRFDPAAGRVAAYTWSATRLQFESDANSRFDLATDLTLPGAYETVGTATVDASGRASVDLPALTPSTPYTWFAEVTTDDGTARSEPATFVSSDGAAVLARDTFERSVSNGWGSADTGQAWTVSSPSAASVAGGSGTLALGAGSGPRAILGGVSRTDLDVTAAVRWDKVPTGASAYAALMPRYVSGSDHYRNRLVVAPDGSLSAEVTRVVGGSETVLARTRLSGITAAPGVAYRIRGQVVGTSPTTIRTKVWRDGTSEPAAWTATATDGSAGLQRSAGVGWWAYLSGSVTNAPLRVSLDDVAVTAPGGGTPPANVAPTAGFTASTTGLTASFTSTSTDSDGTIAAHAWDFGDGATSSQANPTHTYATTGTRTVRLTVTDDDGATATVARSVTVSAPPAGDELARDDFGRTLSGGWGQADSGGAWTVGSPASAFSVASGTGRLAVTAGGSRTASLGQVSSTSTDLSARVGFDKVATGSGTYAALIGRSVTASSGYRARLVVASSGQVRLDVSRMVGGAETILRSAVLTGVQHVAGSQYRVRLVVTGTSPTTLHAWASPAGVAAPATPQVSLTDATAGLQTSGGVGVWAYVSGGSTNAPHTVSVDELRAVRP